MTLRTLHLGLLSIAMGLFTGIGRGADSARIIGESRRTAQRFVEAAQFERENRTAAAVDLYLNILNENGADLIPIDSTGQHLLPARWIVHRRVAGNERLLGAFRERVAAPAKKLLANGIDRRDPKLLKQLVEIMFCARETETALHWLGDWSCERGDFSAAQRYWATLVPGSKDGSLSFPNPAGDAALPAAKILLARKLAGDSVRLSDEISRIELQYPNSKVTLAGRTGRVSDVLRQLTAAPRDFAVNRDSSLGRSVATYARDESRNGTVPRGQPWPSPRQISIPFPDATRESESEAVHRPLISPEHLGQFPVIAKNHVLASDGRRISALELSSGRLTGQFDLKSSIEDLPHLPRNRSARFTLTVADDSVYARLGSPRIRTDRSEGESYVVALQLRPQSKEPLRLRWVLPANRADSTVLSNFEGTPIIHDGKLFVAATRVDNNRATTEVACYNPTGQSPQLIWRQDILETGPDAVDRSSHLLLCAADGLIVCGPYNGAIVALDAENGSRAWAHRYSHIAAGNSRPTSKQPSLNPCIAADGKLFAAPDDYDGAIALDLSTGSFLWECGPIDDGQILGVAAGKVLIQIGGFVSGLRAIDASNGKLLPDWGYAVFGSDAAAPFGRGLVFADNVCWPTRADGIKILRLDGMPELTPAVFQALPGGNIIYGDGHFVVAASNRIHVIAADSKSGDDQNREAP